MPFIKTALLTASVLAFAASAAQASSVTRLVLKASDASAASGTSVVDPYLDWVNSGSVNQGVAGATSLSNNGVDYKDSWVDTNWADVQSVRVSMFSQSAEVAFMEFDAAGTTKSNFFAAANLTSSTWGASGPQSPFTGNYFSIAGHSTIDRHWFVNQSYAGCPSDFGWMVVLDGRANPNYACSWENTRTDAGSTTRGFLYSLETGLTDWQDGRVGIADVFAVSVTYDAAPIPVPASGLLLAGGIGALALRKRRKAT